MAKKNLYFIFSSFILHLVPCRSGENSDPISGSQSPGEDCYKQTLSGGEKARTSGVSGVSIL